MEKPYCGFALVHRILSPSVFLLCGSLWPAGLLLLIWLHGRSGRFAFTASCSGWSRVDGGFTLHVRLMWANGRKQEGSFIFSVCVFEWCSNRQRHVVEVEELYNTWKKHPLASLWQLLYFFFLCTLFFPTVTLQPMYAFGIYWHYTLFEMLFAFAHDIHFSMQLL